MKKMKISKEEILHIANLASLEIKEDEIDKYAKNLEEILNFADIVNNANTNNLDIAETSIRRNRCIFINVSSFFFFFDSSIF